MTNAEIFDISRCSFVDGPGIRTTFYFKGCNLRCKWCHNPESWISQPQLLFYSDKCIHCGVCSHVCQFGAIDDHSHCVACGKCAEACPHGARQLMGKTAGVEELVKIALADKAFYGEMGGITCSGGECLLQLDFLENFFKLLKAENINTAIDTACNVPRKSFERIIGLTDLFLVDIKCISRELHKEFTGVDNKVILENIRFLSDRNSRIWVRVPVVRECNGNKSEMKKIADFVNSINAERVELLPYHTLGVNKARAAGYAAEKFAKIDQQEIEDFYKLFRKDLIK